MPGGRPRKPAGTKALRATFSYRPDQAKIVRRLRREKRLSTVIQAALDAES